MKVKVIEIKHYQLNNLNKIRLCLKDINIVKKLTCGKFKQQ